MQEIKAERLTAAAFTEFGEVIDRRNADFFSINSGRTRRYHGLASVEA